MDCAHLNVEALMPHRGHMRVVETLLEAEDGVCLTRIPVREGSPFLAEGSKLKPCWAVELVAQSVACYIGWAWISKPEKPGSFGYVVAVDDLRVEESAALRVGDAFEVRVTREFELPPAGVFRGEVRLSGRLVAQVTLKTFIENGQAFMGDRSDGSQAHPHHGR